MNIGIVKTWLREGRSPEECRQYAKPEIVALAAVEFEQEKQAVAVSEPDPQTAAISVREPDPFDNLEDEGAEISQPDVNGEFATPADGAVWMATVHRKRQLPLDGKAARLKEWDRSASADPKQIRKWGAEYPGCNFGSVADDGPIFEVDSLEVRKRYGKAFSQTLTVQSSEAKGHRYYLPANVEHIAQNGTKHGDFSLRKHNAYCVSPGSVHPQTGKQYRVVVNAPMLAATQEEIAFWNSERVEKKTSAELAQQAQIPPGQRNSALASIAGKLLDAGMTSEKVKQEIIDINQNRCEPPLSLGELEKTIFASIDSKWSKKPDAITRLNNRLLLEGENVGQLTAVVPTVSVIAAAPVTQTEESLEEQDIPPFDPSVITGIYRHIVDLAVGGTTIPPQFALLNAKVYLGARMAGKVSFEGLDCDSSYYGVAIGITGTSKGESWRRTFEKILNPPELTNIKPQLKVIYSADSGAGLKDAFFEPPNDLPIVCYIDEVTTLGHKAGEKKNPEILDTIIELADSHRVSRVLAKRGSQKSSKTHDNARLSMYACGQDGPAFMSAFAGRTKLGLFDRLYPEFSESIEAGNLSDIKQADIINLQAKISALSFSGKMTMSAETESKLEDFWKTQPSDLRRKIRFKKHLMLDMYMAAFGRGVKIAEPEDLDVAIKIYNRQIKIRQVCFTGEVPDRIGFYASKIKVIIEKMRKDLNSGKTVAQVAKSLRDFQNMTHAFRDNELHTFERAWTSFKGHVAEVKVTAGNGQKYQKWVPMPYENEVWQTDAA